MGHLTYKSSWRHPCLLGSASSCTRAPLSPFDLGDGPPGLVTLGDWRLDFRHPPLGQALLKFYLGTAAGPGHLLDLLLSPGTPGITRSRASVAAVSHLSRGGAPPGLALYLVVSLLLVLCLSMPCSALSAGKTEGYKCSAAQSPGPRAWPHHPRGRLLVASHISYLTTLCDQLEHSTLVIPPKVSTC
eukprot:6212922-Pleurochrysis_carterae.AAC.1